MVLRIVLTRHVIAKGKRLASLMLEASEDDIEFRSGTFCVRGTDRSVSLLAVADPDEPGRQAAQVRSGAQRGYADYREMLACERLDLVSVGTANLQAQVDAQGRVQNLRIVSNNANEAFANICLQSFQEAHSPPIPPDLITDLPEGRMPVDFTFISYSNR